MASKEGFTKLPDKDPDPPAAAAAAGKNKAAAANLLVQPHSYPDGVGFDDLFQDMASSTLTSAGTLMVSGMAGHVRGEVNGARSHSRSLTCTPPQSGGVC